MYAFTKIGTFECTLHACRKAVEDKNSLEGRTKICPEYFLNFPKYHGFARCEALGTLQTSRKQFETLCSEFGEIQVFCRRKECVSKKSHPPTPGLLPLWHVGWCKEIFCT